MGCQKSGVEARQWLIRYILQVALSIPLHQTASLIVLLLLFCCIPPVLLLLLPAPRLIRQGLAKKVDRSRKQLKEKKNRLRKVRGIKKAKN